MIVPLCSVPPPLGTIQGRESYHQHTRLEVHSIRSNPNIIPMTAQGSDRTSQLYPLSWAIRPLQQHKIVITPCHPLNWEHPIHWRIIYPRRLRTYALRKMTRRNFNKSFSILILDSIVPSFRIKLDSPYLLKYRFIRLSGCQQSQSPSLHLKTNIHKRGNKPSTLDYIKHLGTPNCTKEIRYSQLSLGLGNG